jgi:hypothetical protein
MMEYFKPLMSWFEKQNKPPDRYFPVIGDR